MADEPLEFKVGGFCGLKPEAAAKGDSTPARLLKIGWPNRFLIVEIYEDEEKGKLLRLDPCCGWMRDLRDEEKHACEAHPVKYFDPLPGHIAEEVEAEQEADESMVGPRGGRYVAFGRGASEEDLTSLEFVNGGKTKSFFFRHAGSKPFVIQGKAAHRLATFIDKLGIL